ncbi:MAG: hypothetical protein ABSA16_05115 [Thermoguttaceae bacterium]|jgi:hypothetical protein
MKKLLLRDRLVLMIAVLAVCLAFGSQSALADVLYNVDCGMDNQPLMTGAAVLGSDGDVWNAYSGGNWTWGPHNVVTITDSTGSNAAGVTVDIWNYITGADNSGGTTSNPTSLMEDYITAAGWGAGDGWPIKVQLSNLPVSTAFTLVVYSAGDTAGQGATITLSDPSGDIVKTTSAADRDISGGEGDAYVTFSGTTDATGTVYFEVKTTTDDWHALNGIQIAIPEPSMIVLLIMGGLTMLLPFRKR